MLSSGPPPTASVPGLWRDRRPRPHLGGLAGVVGGLTLTAGLTVLLATMSEKSDSRAFAAGVLAAVVVAGLAVALPRLPRGATTIAAVTTAFLLAAAPMGFWLQTADSIGFKAAASLFVLVPTAVWAACFLIGATRGRPVFLAGTLAGLWLLFSVLAVDTGGDATIERGVASYSSDTVQVTSVAVLGAAQESPDDVDGDGIPDQFDPDFVDPDAPDPGGPADSDGDGIPDEFDPDPFDGGSDSGSGESPGFEFGGGSDNTGFDPTSIVPSLFGVPFFFGVGSAGSAVGVVALLFGVGYLAVAAMLDRSARAGTATPFQGVGIAAIVTALSALGGDLGDVATALASVAVGAGLLWLGTSASRRVSAWLGAALAFVGLIALVVSTVDDEVPAGLLLVLLGAGVTVAAQALGGRDDDGDDGEEDTGSALHNYSLT